MSGPQGSDPTQPWQPQPPGQRGEQRSSDSERQTAGVEEPTARPPSWQPPGTPQQPTEAPAWQPPAYPPPQYPPYQQQYPQPMPGYPTPEHYSQQPGPYGQPGQYGQPPQYGQYPPQPYQYGQYGQYPQQPGQYPQPGQYAPYEQLGPDHGSKRRLTVVGAVIGVFAAIVVAVVLVLGFLTPGFFVTTKLDLSKAQEGVQHILSDQSNGYGAKNVKDVNCNDGQSPVVKKGDTFNCDVSIDGVKRKVTVTFQDNKGTYEVGRPQ